MTDPRPVYADPKVWCEPDDTGEAFDPDTQTVGWSLSFGCNVTFAMQDGFLRAQVDADQRAGITQRMVTAGQLRDYAFKLAELANAWEARQAAQAVGCDRTRTCAADRHLELCLGLYRTADEVDQVVFPSMTELRRRRDNEVQVRRHARTAGGGA
jgi:hypothetical protein